MGRRPEQDCEMEAGETLELLHAFTVYHVFYSAIPQLLSISSPESSLVLPSWLVSHVCLFVKRKWRQRKQSESGSLSLKYYALPHPILSLPTAFLYPPFWLF